MQRAKSRHWLPDGTSAARVVAEQLVMAPWDGLLKFLIIDFKQRAIPRLSYDSRRWLSERIKGNSDNTKPL